MKVIPSDEFLETTYPKKEDTLYCEVQIDSLRFQVPESIVEHHQVPTSIYLEKNTECTLQEALVARMASVRLPKEDHYLLIAELRRQLKQEAHRRATAYPNRFDTLPVYTPTNL